jgi:hypothetical protein
MTDLRILADRVPGWAIPRPPAWAARAEPASLPSWRAALRFDCLADLAVRLLITFWAAADLLVQPADQASLEQQYAIWHAPLYGEGVAGLVLGPWQREDSLRYEQIAARGYQAGQGDIVLFPLFPLLLRLVGVVTLGNYAVAGALVSLLATIGAVTVLYRLIQVDFNRLVAERTVAYLLLFPVAYYLLIPYAEPVFLGLVCATFYAVRRGHWAWTALFAFLAALTRLQGVLLAIPIGIEALAVAGWQLRAIPWRKGLPAVAAPILGLAVEQAFNSWIVRDAHSWLEWQAAFGGGKYTTWPWVALAGSLQKVIGERGITVNTFDFAVAVLFLALLALCIRYLRPSYTLWAAAMVLLPLSSFGPIFPLQGLSRYILPTFPCFLALAIWALGRPRAVHLGIIVLWVSFLLIWIMVFIHGHWVA